MNANPKMFSKYTKTKIKFSEKVADLDRLGGSVCLDKDKANGLNDAFNSVFTKEDQNYVLIRENSEFEFPLNDIEINIDVVKRKLKDLKVFKSPGPDCLHPRLLKETTNELALPLSMIFGIFNLF